MRGITILMLLLCGSFTGLWAADPIDGIADRLSRETDAGARKLAASCVGQIAASKSNAGMIAWLSAHVVDDCMQRGKFLEQAVSLGDGRVKWHARLDRARWFIEHGTPDRALPECLDLAESAGEARWRIAALLVQSDACSALGRSQDSADSVHEAISVAEKSAYADPSVDIAALRARLGALTQAHAEVGDPAGAAFAKAEAARNEKRWDDADEAYRSFMKRFPGDARAPAARWALGWCDVRRNRLSQGELRWKRLIDEVPDHPWSAKAAVSLIDTALEERTDTALAASGCDALAAMLDKPGARGAEWDGVRRDLLLRRAILALAAGAADQAKAFVIEAVACKDRRDRVQVNADNGTYTPPAGIARLLDVLERGGDVTPSAALVGKPAMNLRLVLGDIAVLTEDYDRALHLFDVVQQQGGGIQRNYALYRGADIAYSTENMKAFRSGYETAVSESPRAPWAPRIKLSLAVDDYGRGGKEDRAIAGLQRLAQEYPAASEAMSALWYVGVIHFWAGPWSQADEAWAILDRTFPGHPWTEIIDARYRPEIREHLAAERSTKAHAP